ncbi:MAG: CaiB/BaiF CoA-transferase family protein [Burkholderiaceae bacterium]
MSDDSTPACDGPDRSPRPLAGVRVLDLTNVLAGPFCGHQLAHLGAEVIKVEMPGTGDLARQLGADPALNRAGMGVSFLAQNAGKQSLCLNLKHERGKQVFRRLVASADALVENFRPGVMQRLGLDHPSLLTVQPRLVYCAISGFGQDGPMRELPAYDQIIQGLSGVMSITGAPDTAPYRVGYPVADTVGGLTAAMAMCAALAARDAQGRRRAAFLDVSMLEAMLASMGWAVSNLLVAGQEPVAAGNENLTASPSATFATAHGLLNLAANTQQQFVNACRVLHREDLVADARFAEREARLVNRMALNAAFEQALAAAPAAVWAQRFNAAGVPAGEVLSVAQALAQPQVAGRGFVQTFPATEAVGRPVRIARPGVRIDGQPLGVPGGPPALGEHGPQILASLSYSAGEIAQLQADGIA